MADRREALLLAGVAVVTAGAGFFLGPRLMDLVRSPGSDALQTASLTDLAGKPRRFSEWDGLVRVVNFWATWCPPCREEIPALVRTRDELHAKGVEFVGIAIDQAAKVAKFASEVRISYPILLADATGLDLMKSLGNPSGGLPFTLVLDRSGGVAQRNLGALSREKIEAQLRPLLTQA